jgi:hypothetical protein
MAPTLALLFLFCSSNGQDIMDEQPNENDIINLNGISTEKVKVTSERSIKYHVLYSPYIPNGGIGLKLAVGGKFGGYLSTGYGIDYNQITYISGGILFRIKPIIDIYAGTGINLTDVVATGSGAINTSGHAGIEVGTLLTLKFISLEAGFGYGVVAEKSAMDYARHVGNLFYTKLGVGFNF